MLESQCQGHIVANAEKAGWLVLSDLIGGKCFFIGMLVAYTFNDVLAQCRNECVACTRANKNKKIKKTNEEKVRTNYRLKIHVAQALNDG